MRKFSALLCAFVVSACLDPPLETSTTSQGVEVPNAVITWHSNAQTLVGAFTGRGNAAQAYTQALIQIAVYDAVVAIRGGHDPFIAAISAPEGADLSAAIATAAFRTGHERVNSNATARTSYRNQYDAFMAGIPDGQAKTDGIAVGEQAAQAVLAERAGDNFYNTSVFTNPPADPGVWQSVSVTDPFATAGANDYPMAFTIPLTAASADARRAPPPANLHGHLYARDFNEVRRYGRNDNTSRTAAMNDSVQFWTESGFSLWQRNSRDIIVGRGLDELEAARAFAALGVAAGDSMLACWESKYAYLNWRPFQAIQRADEDGNRRTHPEAGWTPAVRANHPEYPSGHACYGTAMTTALRKLFHEDFPVTLSSTGNQLVGWPVVPSRSYASLRDIADDTDDARVWGGLHFRTSMRKSDRWIEDVTNDALCGHFGIKCRHRDDDCGDDD